MYLIDLFYLFLYLYCFVGQIYLYALQLLQTTLFCLICVTFTDIYILYIQKKDKHTTHWVKPRSL